MAALNRSALCAAAGFAAGVVPGGMYDHTVLKGDHQSGHKGPPKAIPVFLTSVVALAAGTGVSALMRNNVGGVIFHASQGVAALGAGFAVANAGAAGYWMLKEAQPHTHGP